MRQFYKYHHTTYQVLFWDNKGVKIAIQQIVNTHELVPVCTLHTKISYVSM